jgi:HrpA-like RNA helicase
MPRFSIPEILRTPLESLFLTVKAMDDTIDVKEFLSRAIDPPKFEAMESAWTTLVDLGAVEGEKGTSRLTALGRHMSMIPVDLRLAKMLVLGTVFKCLDPGTSRSSGNRACLSVRWRLARQSCVGLS